MIALFAAKASLQLFTPLLIGAALALLIFVLGRFIASRKFTRVLDDDDGLLDPPVAQMPQATLRDAPLVGVDAGVAAESVAPRIRELDSPGIRCRAELHDDVPDLIERQRTHKFVRKQAREPASVDEVEEETVRFDRVYLQSADMVSTQ